MADWMSHFDAPISFPCDPKHLYLST